MTSKQRRPPKTPSVRRWHARSPTSFSPSATLNHLFRVSPWRSENNSAQSWRVHPPHVFSFIKERRKRSRRSFFFLWIQTGAQKHASSSRDCEHASAERLQLGDKLSRAIKGEALYPPEEYPPVPFRRQLSVHSLEYLHITRAAKADTLENPNNCIGKTNERAETRGVE